MGPNEKMLREIASEFLLCIVGISIVFAIVFVLAQGVGYTVLFGVRHFGPDDVLKQKCAEYCAE
jgi:hypothetical protein